uniref:Putative 17. protein in melC2-rnhH intergenic region n=1 Tax=Anthurium amnicola TaxID=1678845 RepID=A0A1D1XP30_9ARAE
MPWSMERTARSAGFTACSPEQPWPSDHLGSVVGLKLLIPKDTFRQVAEIEIDVPCSVAYDCYSDREAIPQWMPFISSVKVLKDKPDLSRWTLKYEVLGRDVEVSWLARNLQPIRNQKIHWRSLDGLPNR